MRGAGARSDTAKMTWRHIMFFVDRPAGLERGIVQKVGQLARGLDAEVEVFDCIFDPAITDDREVQEALDQRARELEAVVQFLRECSVRSRVTVHWAHPPREGVIRQIQKLPPDLLVIQSKRHSRLARLLLSYSDYKLIETAPCPLWVIKNVRPYDGGRVVAAMDPLHLHGQLTGLDERILGAASVISRGMGMPLHFFHACMAGVESGVKQLAHSYQAPEGQVHVEIGDPAVLLPRFVHGESSDLLVMGAVARSRIRRTLIGYTAERVLDATDCDLLIVRNDPA